MTFFTADQLVAHAVGDYILQSDWMADNKTKQHFAAAVHAVTYTLPFLFITWSPAALAVICGTHFVIDRWRLARFVVWLKNGPWLATPVLHEGALDGYAWSLKPVTATGYQDSKPPFLAIWLLIIADNILHVICNALALRYFA
jgi:hypothetical protein